MTRSTRLACLPWTAAALGLLLTGGVVSAHDDHELASASPAASLAPGISVSDAWTRASTMVDLAGAAFLVIHNSTDVDDALLGAMSSAAAVVELHQTTTAADGTMAMAPVEEVPVPAGGEAVLEPGGYHIMLIGLVEPLVVGESIEVGLEFASAEPLVVTVPVEAVGPMADSDDDSDDADDDPDETHEPDDSDTVDDDDAVDDSDSDDA